KLSGTAAITATATVTNEGGLDGEEVVQLYVSVPGKDAPTRSLKGFQRIFLKKGESRVVRFTLRPEDISIMDNNGNPRKTSGRVTISIGGRQPDAANEKTGNVVQSAIELR
ncbi:MAG TPA: fibronectin type III-like domain-contianing protein, partial [Chitinophagaceae bacterium]|nr:fibronectin type III-like domain-contianing protein [Chitinophagaceae bacterium]